MKSEIAAAAVASLCLCMSLAAAPADTMWTKPAGGAAVVTDRSGASYVLQRAVEEPASAAMLVKYSVAGRELWRRTLPADNGYPVKLLMDSTGAPVVAGSVTARYSAANGALMQKTVVPGKWDPVDAATLPGGGVVIARADGSISALNKNLTVKWTVTRDWEPVTLAVAADGGVWVGGFFVQWIPDPFGAASHHLARIERLNPSTGESSSTPWTSARQLKIGALAASPDGTVVAVGDGFFLDGDYWSTGAQIFKVNTAAYVEWWRSSRDFHQEVQFSNYAAESKVLIDRHGTVFAGFVSGNTGYDEADGEPNGVAFVKISRNGTLQWYHRFQEPAVTMRTPQMELDFTGDLIVGAGGSIQHSDPHGNWSRVFRLQPNGVRTNETEPLPQFHINGLALVADLLPVVTGYHGLSTWDPWNPETAGLSIHTQLPSGPLVAGTPRLSRDGTKVSVPALARRGPLRWQWLMDDRPIPGATSATLTIPPDDNPYRAFSVIVSDNTGTAETPVLVVVDSNTTTAPR